MPTLPQPEVLSCYFDSGFSPCLAAMRLRWPAPSAGGVRGWDLPGGVRLTGPPPEAFGVRLQRWGDDSYAACLLWDSMRLQWSALTRAQVLDSALAPILAALGGDLGYYLDQPVTQEITPFLKAS